VTTPRKRICLFCGSRAGLDPRFRDTVAAFARIVARRGLEIVYGGGNVGLMGVIADAALAEGGRVIGVIPRALMVRELAHRGVTELFVTETMHERKERMITLSDAFVALPGGFGTYDELFETVTLGQIGIIDKPNAIYDAHGYFAPLLALIRHTIEAGFATDDDARTLVVDADPERLLDKVMAWTPEIRGSKWA
jgi:uncharacterized protein (TIGR00730 family)